MIGIVMTHLERQWQLEKTLLSMVPSKAEFFVVVVDDGSEHLPRIPKVPFQVKVLRTRNKCWTNPEPAYNLGIQEALKRRPDIIVLQNAECYHVGDVLKYAETVTDSTYISFGCFSIDEESTFANQLPLNNKGAKNDGECAWYNHPEYRPKGYDFCSAITTMNMIKLNGYDERLAFGCGYGDDYLLERIKMLGLTVEITKEPFVVHQWHYTFPAMGIFGERKKILIEKNKILFERLKRENDFVAKHYICKDFGYESVVNQSVEC